MNYADILVSDLACVRKGETLCVLVDEHVEKELYEPVVRSANKLGVETHLLIVASESLTSDTVLGVASEYSVLIAITRGPGYDPSSLAKINSSGTRVIKLAHASLALAKECLPVDYIKMRKEAKALDKILRGGKQIRVTTPKGSDFFLSTYGRTPYYWDSVIRKGGTLYLPRGSVNTAPVEDVGEGSIVIDGTTWEFGKVDSVFELKLVDGRVVKVTGSGKEAKWLRSMLERPFENTNRLAEFVIGLNPRATFDKFMPEGEKARGAISIDLGTRSELADTVPGKHIDVGSMREATVVIDGRKIVDRGTLTI